MECGRLNKKVFSYFLLGFLLLSMLAPVVFAENEKDFKKQAKTLNYDDNGAKKGVDVQITKLNPYDADRNNANLYVSYVDSSGYKAIRFSDMLNSKGAIGYIPVDVCEKLLGSPPYGMYDTRYYPKKVDINKVLYYQFKIPHFSTVDITDWQYSNFAYRLKVSYNLEAYVDADTCNIPVPLIFKDANTSIGSDFWTNRGDDTANHIRICQANTSSTDIVELDYENVAFVTSGSKIARYWVELARADNDNDSDIYVYYAQDGTTSYNDVSGTWNNGSKIWHLDESSGTTATDSLVSQNGTNNGATVNTASLTSGVIGTCYDFESGDSDYVDLANSLAHTTFTIVAWVLPETASGYHTVFGRSESGGDSGFAKMGFYSNQYTSYIHTTRANGGTPSTTIWHMMSWTQTPTQAYIYIDGGSSATVSNAIGTDVATQKTCLGRPGSWSSWYYDGLIDEVWYFTDVKVTNWRSVVFNTIYNYISIVSYSNQPFPTFAITESPTATTYSSPSSLDINVTITNGGSVTFEECNFSYYDGSWHTIKNRVVTGDADKKTWSSSKIAWRWDDTNNFDELGAGDYNVSVDVFDGTTWYTKAISTKFTLQFNQAPNAPTITRIGLVDVNATTAYDEDTGNPTFSLSLKGYNSSDPDGDNQKWAWIIDDDYAFGSIDGNSGYIAPIDHVWTTALTKNKDWYFRIDAIDPTGSNTVNSSSIWKETLTNRSPIKPVVTAPSGDTYDTTPAVTWTASTDGDGDTLTYRVEISNASGVVRQSAWTATSGYANDTALDYGEYNVTVTVNDGTETNASAVSTFTVILNTNPNKPTVTSIGNETNTSTIYDEDSGATFQITLKGYNSSDYDGDLQNFKWEVDDNSNFGSPEFSVDSLGSGDINRTMTTTLTKKSYYWFRLGAIDPAGANDYNYSTAFYMYLGNRVPSRPVVTSPTTTTYDTTPAISWTNSSDTDGDAIQYRVEISNASGLVRQSAYGVSQPYTNSTALSLGDYNITIYAYDSYDTNTSAVETFEVIGNTPPNAPTITTVAGSATNATVYDQDATAGVLWYLRGYNSSDPDGNAQNFKWEIDNNSNFGSPEYSASSLGVADINRSMTTALNRNISYYVRLGAIDPLGANDYNYSDVLLLLFENYAPTAGALTAPDDNSTTCDTTVFMSWGAGTDTDGDTVTKQVRVYDSLGNKDYNNTFGADVNATTGVLTADTYTWKVVYYDGYDYTNSSTRTFAVVANAIPSVPTLSTPANFAKDINPATVTLDWADSTDVCGDAITYTVQWSTSYTFTTYSEATSAVSTYAIPTELYTEQIYYWRVKSTDVIGSTAWSSIYEFQTESSAGGSGSDQYELRMEGAYDKSSGRVEVTAWIQKNGQMVTGMSGVSIVMKDESNTTVHTFDDGTVYVDGFYKAVWTTTGLHGVYSLKGTATYSGNTYYGGSHFDAGIMEIFDALDSMETTINLIDDYVDTLETNVNATNTNVTTILGYVGTPADTSASNTLFGYSQYLKDKWGTQTADTIYNKVVDVYTIVNASNSTVTDIQSTLDDLDTYIRTYQGVEINVGSSYSFVDDQLEVTVAYVKDGAIQNTTSCTMLIKDTDGTTLKTFTDADDADNIYRYEWNSSAVDFPTNGFYGGYTIIPSVVYSGNTFSTVRTFSAEMPDLYGTTSYSSATTTYVDSGYSVALTSAYTGSIIYVKVDSADATLDLTNVTVTAWWEDSTSTVLATTSTTGTVSSGILRFSATIPSGANGASQLRVSAEKTVYGHRTTTLSGLATGLTITSAPVGGGLPPSITKLEIRNCPESAKAGDTIDVTVLATKSRSYNTGYFAIALKDKYETYTETTYELKFTGDTQDAVVKFKVPLGMDAGDYELTANVNGLVKDTAPFSVVKRKGLFDGLFENGFEIRIPDTDIVIRFK